MCDLLLYLHEIQKQYYCCSIKFKRHYLTGPMSPSHQQRYSSSVISFPLLGLTISVVICYY